MGKKVSKKEVKVQRKTGAIFGLFQQAIAAEDVFQIEKAQRVVRGGGSYTTWWVIWLMIWQRVNPQHSLSATVQQMCALSQNSGKKLSKNTGGYSQARTTITVETVERVVDQLSEYLLGLFKKTGRFFGRRVFVLDGSSISLENTPELIKEFGLPSSQGKNKRKTSHWPKLLVAVAHELYTGIALRPEYGAMHGKNSTGEIRLSLNLIPRLPKDSILLADRAYGIFSIAHFAGKHGHKVLVRMTDSRLKKVLGRVPKRATDAQITWQASANDRRTNPDIDKNAEIKGRIISAVLTVPGIKRQKRVRINIFTTLTEPANEIIKLYCMRWNIELDLRSLKSELAMNKLTGKSAGIVKKELLLGVAAYSLIRATMALAAQKSQHENPRAISFSNSLNVIFLYLPQILCAQSRKQIHILEDLLLDAIATSPTITRRKKHKPAPRVIMRRNPKYPLFSGTRKQAINKYAELS
jgi:hypothetical protein